MSERHPGVETGVDDPRRSKPWVLGIIKVMSRVSGEAWFSNT